MRRAKISESPAGADISFPIWGKNYVEPFLRVTLRLMLADGNLPGLAQRTNVHARFYTTKKDESVIRRSPQFRLLEKYANCSFNTMVDKFLAQQQSLSCMNVCQRDALTRGFQAKRLLFPFTGDVVITENLLSEAWDLVMQGYRLVVGAGLRLNRTAVLARAKKTSGIVWNLTNREAVKLALRDRHIYSKRQTIGWPRVIYSAELYAEAPEYLVSRCFALAPFALFPRKLEALPKITFDDDFIDFLFPERNEIRVLQDVFKEGAIFSLTDESERNHSDDEATYLQPFHYADKIHHFLCNGNLGKTHLFYFENPVWYGSKKSAMAIKANDQIRELGNSIRNFLQIFIILQNPFSRVKETKAKKEKWSNFKSQKTVLLKKLYAHVPELFILFFDRDGFYRETKLQKEKRLRVTLKILKVLARPLVRELAFLLTFCSSPWRVGLIIKKATDPRFTPPPHPLTASFLRKFRNLFWPFFMLLLFQMGATMSKVKIVILRLFGSRCAWNVKIHRGVYFKNPWNVVIRRNVEINTDVLFDTPSVELRLGTNAKIGARSYLATVRATPFSWQTDAVNKQVTVASESRILEGSIILPEMK